MIAAAQQDVQGQVQRHDVVLRDEPPEDGGRPGSHQHLQGLQDVRQERTSCQT